MSQDLEKFGMPEEELFAPVDHSDLESEKITAPRYSYWHSVFRVFFKKKINIIILAILGVLIAFTYLYPLFVEYDKFGNLMDATTKHLSPSAAIERLGMNIHWILGTGAAGQSTFGCRMVWIKDFHFPCIYLCSDQPFRWCCCRIYLGIFKESGCFYAGGI